MSSLSDKPAVSAPSKAAGQAAHLKAATVRAILVAVILALLVNAWNKQAELVTLTSQISESTPPIASVMCLFLMLGLTAMLTRIAGHCETRKVFPSLGRLARKLIFAPGEILVVFVFLAIIGAMPGVGLFRQIMPCLMVTQYFGQPNNHLDEMAQNIPAAWAPNNAEIARVFWEGGDVKVPTFGLDAIPVIGPPLESCLRFLAAPAIIPWKIWAGPFALWCVYFSIYFITAFCLVSLFRRTWEEDERLSFPVSSLAVDMIRPEGSLISGKNFFRDPVVWIGFSLAILYNATNAIKAFNPGVPALGIAYPLGQFFTESPWNTMQGFQIFYKPEILGIGYLVPSDVLLSIWVFTILGWIVRPFAKMSGYEPAGFPFMTNQAMGAFVLLGFYFIWLARPQLMRIFRKAIGSEPGLDDTEEPFSFQFMFWAAAVGLLIVFTMPIFFGVVWWMSALYFGLMFIVLIVYCRNRAEMGFPIVWGYPLYQERASMLDFLGSRAFLPNGNPASITMLTMFSWLQRSVNQAMTSIGVEGWVAGQRLGVGRRQIAKVVIGALIFGLVVAFLVNLSSYYEYGGLVLSSAGGTEGGQMTQEVLSQFTAISQWMDKPEAPNKTKMGYTIFGGLMVLAMIVARRAWVRFPFHPGGYALAYCHGGPYMWFPAFVLWIVKTLTLHIGGVGAYRRVAPGFMAFTIGHFFSVGVWSLVGLYAQEVVRRYVVWFL